jgi:hypothetical protein
MGFLSPYTLIRTVSIFHLSAAYFFLASPRKLVDQNVVFMLGESMRLVRQDQLQETKCRTNQTPQPHITTMDTPSEASAFIAVLLVFLGLADLTAASLPALPALEYWLGNVPVRLTVLFALTAYSYLCKEGGMLGAATGVGANLCNSWVFSWAFMELMVWYWVSLSPISTPTWMAE